VDIAIARATTDYTEAQRATLSAQQADARLDARTREANAAQRDADRSRQQAYSARDDADRARQQVGSARDDAERAQREAMVARGDASQARTDTADASARERAALAAAQLEAQQYAERDRVRDASMQASREETARLQRQIEELNAERTNRGLVLTLGDVLYATGRAELRDDAASNLDRLVAFLNEYPTRNLEIEGHTDAVGNAAYNQDLSERRAASVKAYLVRNGIGSERMSVTGKGMDSPRVANAADGSQALNRRVEVIILEPGVALPLASRSR